MQAIKEVLPRTREVALQTGKSTIPPQCSVLQFADDAGQMPADASAAEEAKAVEHHSAERRFHELFFGRTAHHDFRSGHINM